jgi:diaminohydroxyphosphoribosylaminopyrimidine deaminase/5-amino-6-(5-phosphoribosylamino)uracil reductase
MENTKERLTQRNDERYMRVALKLAARAQGRTSPNPMVGAVIVRGERIVGSGYHRRAGEPHAEVEALRAAGVSAQGSTLYVTLEPCNHTGRTPPCCDAIIASGIAHVVVACRDPNPITSGRGIARLRRAGIRVTIGTLASEVLRLNAPFHKAMTTRLPFVIAKIGQSLDGKIATAHGESRWITSPAARALAHKWRSQVDALLVGINTVLRDNPLLTVRGYTHRSNRPIKVIVDSRLRISPSAQCLSRRSPTPSLIATTNRSMSRRAALARAGAEVLVLPAREKRVPLRRLLRALAARGIHSVLIEGGGEILAGALAERLVDRIVFFIAPVLIGGRNSPGAVAGEGITRLAQALRLDGMTSRHVGRDLCIEANVVYPSG